MKILLENILDKDLLSSIDSKSLQSINEAINNEITKHKKDVEKEVSKKFEKIVENINEKFEDYVKKGIKENVKDSLTSDVNKKLFETVVGIVNLLENSGLYNTEKTKQLSIELKNINKKLEDAYKEREKVKEELNEEKKLNFIYQTLSGMHPNIVSYAIEYFKDKDIYDVQDEIDAFLEKDFSKLIQNVDDKFNDGFTDISLDQVEDTLKKIKKDKEYHFESLGKGLLKQKGSGLNRSPTVDLDAIVETKEDEFSKMVYEEDTNIALNQINNFKNLGYKIWKTKHD